MSTSLMTFVLFLCWINGSATNLCPCLLPKKDLSGRNYLQEDLKPVPKGASRKTIRQDFGHATHKILSL